MHAVVREQVGVRLHAAEIVDRDEHARERARLIQPQLAARRDLLLHVGEVAAGAEMRTLAGQHDAAHSLVGVEPGGRLRQLADHLSGHRVALFRPRQRQPGHAARVDVQRDRLVAHVIARMSSRPISMRRISEVPPPIVPNLASR